MLKSLGRSWRLFGQARHNDLFVINLNKKLALS